MEMNVPVGSTALDVSARRVVGKPLDRVDGRLKVTGGALYAYEFEQGPKTAYGVLVEASIGKGRIKSIDTDSAERAPGVILVLTYRNAPEQGTGNHHVAHPVLTSPEVLYYGLPVAFVVAETFEEATAAAYLVRVNYDGAPGRYTLRSGLDEARIPQEGPPPDSAVGDFAAAFATAPVQLDVTYTTPLQSHAMMEPHATLAVWEGDNLILHTSNQMLNQGRDAVARTLEIPVENVRLVSPFIGGGFGAKLWVNADAILAAIAARQLDRPVKTALTRQQVFQVTTHRSDTIQRIRLGTDRNGRILAIGHDVFSGNLWSEQNYEGAALQTRTLYAGDNRLTRHRLAPLDIPVASSMRAPGEAAGLLALEESREHGLRRVHAGEQVDGRDAELERRLVGFAVERHQPGLALDQEVVAGTRGFRSGPVVAGDRAVDQVVAFLLQLLVAEAQFLRAAELEVLDHDVALRGEFARDPLAFGGLQVEAHRALVAVDAVEIRGLGRADAQAPVAGIVAASRMLDLDDFGAEVAEHHAAPGARQHAGKIEHAHAGKRQRGIQVRHWKSVFS